MSIDPARLQSQRLHLAAPEAKPAPRKRPPPRACAGGCGKGTRDASGTCPDCQAVADLRVVADLTVDELVAIIAAARAELDRRANLIAAARENT